MKLWTPFWRRADDAITQALHEATARNMQQEEQSQQARAELTAAVEAEQTQIRRNHLGELLHDALIARRHP